MKTLGLIAYLCFIIPVGYMLIRWPGESTKTFSQNAARHRASIIYYGVMLTVFLTFLSIFAYGWLVPTLRLSTLFSIVFGVGVAGELVAGLVPETTGWKKTTHIVASGVMYLATLLIVSLLFAHSATPHAGKIVSAVAFTIMAAVILSALLFKRSQQHALLLQTIHLACFFSTLLTVTYSY